MQARLNTPITFILLALFITVSPPLCIGAGEPPPQSALSLVLGYSTDGEDTLLRQSRMMLNELQERTGIHFKLRHFPSKRSLLSANNGLIDGELARAYELQESPLASNLLLVDAPWLEANLAVLVPTSSIWKPRNWEDLPGHTVCHKRNLIVAEAMTSELNVQTLTTTLNAQVLKKLNAGHCDSAIAWKERLTKEHLEFLNENSIELTGILITSAGYIYLHKKHKTLIPVIQESLIQISADGTRRKILQKIPPLQWNALTEDPPKRRE